ncbi:type II toxin-antitoxin system HicB family antitoxin [Rhodomicrobium lacus]|uniref:type II toxin-antitoxin system HicB family antitoxin n=1 Tax=Rhodomicrobium lacus TaxID=2498452 RepID=UPI000F8C4AD8|nr:type II toxin-antitoxin system HicB family antitoxin [Rhodomicrobium lacus]
MTDATYPAVVIKLPEKDGGGFLAYAPDLPGCMSDGETDAEALQYLRLAVDEWCDEAKRLGRDVPKPGSAAKAAQTHREDVAHLVKLQTER